MIALVMRPVKDAPTVRYEGMYSVDMNGIPLGLTVRARNAKAAEEKLRFLFARELGGKNVDFSIGGFEERGKDEDRETETRPDAGSAE